LCSNTIFVPSAKENAVLMKKPGKTIKRDEMAGLIDVPIALARALQVQVVQRAV